MKDSHKNDQKVERDTERFSRHCILGLMFVPPTVGADQTDFERLYISPWVMSDHMMLTHLEGLDSLQHLCDPFMDRKSKA